MGNGINLEAIYIANLMAIVLILFAQFTNRWRVVNDKTEDLCIRIMIYDAFVACVADPLSFSFDGKPGLFAYVIVYSCNWILFFSNMVVGPAWMYLILHHVRGSLHRHEKLMIEVICVIGTALLLINFFYPIVFHINENNVYQRNIMYSYYITVVFIFIVYSNIAYLHARWKGGVLIFFPVFQFVIPVIIGLAVQTCFYGVSTIPSFVVVSIICMITSLQNENIFRDSLTGLYNRTYLDHVKESFQRKKSGFVTAMMLDMNDFKAINDRLGHKVGDEALVAISQILRASIREYGTVIRYAGDEFVILLNGHQEEMVQGRIDVIQKKINDFNRKKDQPYQLSVAIGYCSVDLKKDSVDTLMNEVDRRMYENKEMYYQNNPDKNRRKR